MLTPWGQVRWRNVIFLFGTALTTLTAVPLYLWHFGLGAFQLALFLAFFIATGLSITLGYHRLFSHLTFQAHWSVKLFTLLFGAAAFEGSALEWSADHRRHHKHVDQDEDPYDISKGFFHAHIGWLLFRTGPDTPLTWVRDLQKDKLAVWQHRHYVALAFGVGFGLPAVLGLLAGGWVGALGAFLLAGVARVVFVHHMTFCINSLCHWIGDRPYSTRISARDSLIMAFFTFGEGYHNFHHEFQHDYRNGVKPWQFDPTKWTIWLLHKLGLARSLRTVPEARIIKAQVAEKQRQLAAKLSAHPTPVSEALHALVQAAQQRLHDAMAHWEAARERWHEASERRTEHSRAQRRALKREHDEAMERLREALRQFARAHEVA
jgi:stearoyl-CoA desaturase (delta-9 desaturase)